MTKKALLCIAMAISFSCTASANGLVDKAKELPASECERLRAPLHLELNLRRSGCSISNYSDILEANFANYSIEELEELSDYIDGLAEVEHIVTVTPYNDLISSQDSACFMFYSTVQDASDFFDYVTQNHNPEVTFDAKSQTVDTLGLYMTYFADCTAEEARQAVELYTDELIYALEGTYPNVCIDFLTVSWKIPSIDEESLYAARFFCESDDGSLIRGDGSGLIYQE